MMIVVVAHTFVEEARAEIIRKLSAHRVGRGKGVKMVGYTTDHLL